MPKTLPIALLALLALSPGLRAQEDNIDVWDNQPLGPTVPIPPVGPPRVNRELKSNRVSQPLAGAPVLLAENGRARAAIVIPAKSEERQYVAAERAARLLQAKVQAASQATLPIVSHDDSQTSRLVDGKLRVTADNQVFDYAVLIGDHPFAADNGVATKSLPEEGFLLKTAGNAICIAGDHDSAIYAVIDLLEQYGFRTLWPGELGTVVPKLPTFAVQPVQVSDAPALHQRHMRSADTYKPREWNLPADRQEWFTPAELGPYDDYGDRPLTGLYNLEIRAPAYAALGPGQGRMVALATPRRLPQSRRRTRLQLRLGKIRPGPFGLLRPAQKRQPAPPAQGQPPPRTALLQQAGSDRRHRQ